MLFCGLLLLSYANAETFTQNSQLDSEIEAKVYVAPEHILISENKLFAFINN